MKRKHIQDDSSLLSHCRERDTAMERKQTGMNHVVLDQNCPGYMDFSIYRQRTIDENACLYTNTDTQIHVSLCPLRGLGSNDNPGTMRHLASR